MSEYADANKHKDLIGKRARIKQQKDYCSFLWGHSGEIQEVYNKLFLKFDVVAKRREDDNLDIMNGVYLTESAFELLE